MKKPRTLSLLLILAAVATTPGQQSCKKDETVNHPVYLSVDLPGLTLQDSSYYLLGFDDRMVELEFTEPIDTTSIRGNLSFSDKLGIPDSAYTFIGLDRKILLTFDPELVLKPGWRYLITIGTGLRSVTGKTFSALKILDLRTGSRDLALAGGPLQRDVILCISDLHLGEDRAIAGNYCWFGDNQAALLDLLDYVLTGGDVRELVILGDLFDGWIIPYRFSPFDTAAGVHDISGYFHSVANSQMNRPIMDKLRAIASGGVTRLVYVPGNHDMLLTQGILEEIIPGVVWQGNIPGLGNYSPVDEIIMEHGHRMDFFNCPQPLVNSGHMLPPGFFISRLQAQGQHEHPAARLKQDYTGNGSVEFRLAWEVACIHILLSYPMNVRPDSVNISMGGIDGYTDPFSFNGARDMYAASIEDLWPATQAQNSVPVSIPVSMAILDGTTDMFLAASFEYLSTASPKRYKMAVFGHTHNAELKVYSSGSQKAIYANSGTWWNEKLDAKKKARTYLAIRPGQWTGSDLDVVTLYQYNPGPGGGGDWIHSKLDEKSVCIAN
jgi:UDP-2,3-diacylglucosamine pyrophosphatase LpxH